MSRLIFPNESSEYRIARNRLVDAEIALRARIEQVAALRRNLPPGGKLKEDYTFERRGSDDSTESVSLSGLFEPGKSSLLIYSFMYGPAMEQPCPMCSSMLDGLNGNARHLRERISLAVVAGSPLKRITDFAGSRGWSDLPLLSSANNSYNLDYFGETPNGNQMPMANVFVRSGETIRHSWGSEMLYADLEGQPRHVDLLWPLWNALDLTPEGRGDDWYPPL